MNRSVLFLDPKQMKIYKTKKTLFLIVLYTFLIVIALFIIVPFYYMLVTSLKTTSEINSDQFIFFPRSWVWENYSELFTNKNGTITRGISLLNMYKNTVLVAFLTTIGTIITVVLSAFAFSRLNFKGRELIFSILLMTMMIPGEIYVITNYQTIGSLGWRNTYQALVLPFATSVFYTFFLRQTFKQIPNELYLAAKVDGTSDFGYLWKVMIPVAKATIITIIILSMIGTWNAFVWPSLVTNQKDMYLVSNGLLEMFKGKVEQSGPDSILNVQMAGSTMITVPLLIVFIALRKYIMSGVSRSGIKG
ncbi:MAG TPA: carbohydrate ABC transporter permease [Bacilli bacterium]|nr:carbohydrate ABC transporter permease [Bacilli bacterium]